MILKYITYLLIAACSATTLPLVAGEAKTHHVKATIERLPWDILPNASAAVGTPAANVMRGLNGRVLEEYDDIDLVEIHEADKHRLKDRGREHSRLVTLYETFDTVFLNGHTIDTRGGNANASPGGSLDPPYSGDEQGSWLIQFTGPIKDSWLRSLENEGIVLVQYVPMNAYIVGARQSAVRSATTLPFVQWTSQLHRFLKPALGLRSEEAVELWIELAQTDETDQTVALLQKLALKPIKTSLFSKAELRVQGVFRTADIDLILALPLVVMLDEKPHIALSGERAALGVTSLIPDVGSPASAAGKYKKWLNDACPSCESVNSNVAGVDLLSDGFYIGIADTGLDGGDRVANGSLSGEVSSSNLHRAELANRTVAGQTNATLNQRLRWGTSFEHTSFTGGHTWSSCASSGRCPDTTGSKHDTIGHGTVVAAIAAADPPAAGGKDSDGLFWAFGVAPSAGIAVTKINPNDVGSGDQLLIAITDDALQMGSYWQNFSLNQYEPPGMQSTGDCFRMYDGRYSQLSREFDAAVINGSLTGNQPITLVVSSGNANQQDFANISNCRWVDRTLTLPPATAKNVIAIGGAELVRPESWKCVDARADSYANLAFHAKHGTATPGWYKPDLIAVSANTSGVKSHDQVPAVFGCSISTVPAPYLGGTGTSFAAPIGSGSAALAARRFSSNPAGARPALVKAMLIAGAKSMRDGSDRVRMTNWRPGAYVVGNRVIPTVPDGHYYEVESVQFVTTTPNPAEPQWSQAHNGGTVTHQATQNHFLTWRDKGLEAQTIGAFPNSRQGFGRIHLDDVLSDYPHRVFINEEEQLSQGQVWSDTFTIHDPALPVRIALAWTDAPGVAQPAWGEGTTAPPAPPSPIVTNLNLSVRFQPGGTCTSRYVGNVLNANEESILQLTCDGGTHDDKNNVEIVRFSAVSGTTFEVRVANAQGGTQRFALVVWNAYVGDSPPATPATLTATASSGSQVMLSWPSVGAPKYEIQRSLGAYDPYVTLTSQVTTNSFVDTNVIPGTTYLYRVRATNTNRTRFSNWVVDPATTVVFNTPLAVGVVIRASHINELRQAVGSIRAAGGLSPFAWTDSAQLPVSSAVVKAAYVTELRTALNQGRAALGLPAVSFTDGTLIPATSVMRAMYIGELRGGVE